MTIIERVRQKRNLPEPKETIAAPKMRPPLMPGTQSIVVHRTTVNEMRDELFEKLGNGEQLPCPVCSQNCKLYKRKLNAMQAVFLCWLVNRFRDNGGCWINVPKEYKRNIGGEYGKLAHWELIELKPNDDDPSKRTSGLWRPTLKGIDFVNEVQTVPKYIYLYNNLLHKVSKEQTTIREALGDKFDYEELMER